MHQYEVTYYASVTVAANNQDEARQIAETEAGTWYVRDTLVEPVVSDVERLWGEDID